MAKQLRLAGFSRKGSFLFITHKKTIYHWVIIFQLLTILNLHALSQNSNSTIEAKKIEEKEFLFDGELSEPFWKNINAVKQFVQREPEYGNPVSEETRVAVVYTSREIIFGIWCFQKDPHKIIAKNLSVDFDYESDDNFQIMISPFNDNRTGYLFIINPNGARTDILIYSIERGNEDWNGVWDARTRITKEGWFAEVVIPFNTLQFKKGKDLNWAINFERDIAYKNEQALWQGWSRDYSIYSIVHAGKLTGLNDISHISRFEFKPYLLTGWSFQNEEGHSWPIRAGGDLNINITPTLKLNFTSFTDFAQVENDRIPVNLSRFSVYYPEKRQFFLEGSNYYTYYLGERNSAFYSRQIGIEENTQVPIIAGVRLFGKEGKHNLGFLNIQEGKFDTIPSANNTVFRYKHDIGEQSYIGGIFTQVLSKDYSNQVIGVDGMYQTSKFLGDKNLSISGHVTGNFENMNLADKKLSYRLSVDYPNDLIDNYMSYSVIEDNFSPALGFLRRDNYQALTWFFRITPRWFEKFGVRKMLFRPWGFMWYRSLSTHQTETFFNEIRPLGVLFKSGDRFEFNIRQQFEYLEEAFDISDSITIDKGKYSMQKYELQIETYSSRRIWFSFQYSWGGFYSGKVNTLNLESGINFSKHLNVNLEYTFNRLTFGEEKINTHELATYANYAINTRLNISFFGQYNNLEKLMIYNIRLHWIPRIGSDLYFVYNLGYNQDIHQIDWQKPESSSAAFKIIYRIVF